jgi:PAS domain S-box-containing protein
MKSIETPHSRMSKRNTILIDQEQNILSWGEGVDLFWGLHKGMSLSEVFCANICVAYSNHINTGSKKSFSFNQADVFEIEEELRFISPSQYEITLSLPANVYDSFSSERLSLLEDMLFGASIQNRHGEILFANNKALAVYGREQEVTIGTGSVDAVWRVQNAEGVDLKPDDIPTLRCIKENRVLENEVIAIFNPAKKDRIWLEVSCLPIRLKGFILPHAIQCTFSEITKRIKNNINYQSLLAEEDFVIRLSNQLLKSVKNDFHSQQKFIINKIGEHCFAESAYIIDLKNLRNNVPNVSSWFKDGLQSGREEADIHSFLVSSVARTTDWIKEAKSYQVDRISLEMHKSEHLKHLEKNKVESLLYLPIILGNEVIAIIMLHRKINTRSFKKNDSYLLSRVSELFLSLCAQHETDRKLRESKKKLSRLSSGISDIIWITDLNAKPNYVSNSVKTMLDMSPTEFIEGKKGLALQKLSKIELLGIIKKLEEGSSNSQFFALQNGFTRNGERLLLSHKVRGEFNESGQLSGLIITTSDETKLNRTFLALKESEFKYHALFQNSPLGLLIYHPEDGILDCNASAAKTLGYSIKELKTRNVENIKPKSQPNGQNSAALFKSQVDDAFKGKRPKSIWVLQNSDKKAVTIEAQLNTFKTGDRTLILVSWQDLSQRIDDKEKINRLNLAIENSPVGMVITNTRAEIIYVNPAIISNTGYSSEELMGQNPRILNSGLNPKGVFQDMWKALLEDKDWKGVFHNKRKNGELYWERVHISPVKNTMGVVSHYLAVKEDITLLKQYLEAIEKHNTTLKEIAWTQSHVMRAPLARLQGLIELYKEKAFDDSFSEERVLELMEDSTQELDSIIAEVNEKSYADRKILKHLKGNPFVS